MADPLSDPRARDLLAADPGAVGMAAYTLQVVAVEAGAVAGGLRSASGSSEQWWGQAADAFRHTVGNYPAQLDKVHSSYGEAASALNRYEGELASLQSSFRSVQQQLESARSSAGALSNQLSAQGQQLTGDNNMLRLEINGHNKPTAAQISADALAGENYASTSNALGQVQGEVSSLEAQAFRILDSFAGERSSVVSRLSAAAALAPKNPPWWDRALHEVGDFAKGVALGAYHAGKDLVPAVEAFYDHPGWETLGRLASDVGTLAGTAALLVTLFVAPEAMPELAIGEEAFSAADIVGGVATASNVVAGASDMAEGHYADGAMMIGFAAGGEAMDVTKTSASSWLGIGERQSSAAEGELGALETYAKGAAPGASDEAFGKLMDMSNEKWAIVKQHLGTDDGSPESVAAAERSIDWQKQAVAAAQKYARFAGAPIDYGIDQAVLDPLRKVGNDGLRFALHGHAFTTDEDWGETPGG